MLVIAKMENGMICVKRRNGAVIARTIVEDTDLKRQSLQCWIDGYYTRKAK